MITPDAIKKSYMSLQAPIRDNIPDTFQVRICHLITEAMATLLVYLVTNVILNIQSDIIDLTMDDYNTRSGDDQSGGASQFVLDLINFQEF
jgi:hypothetical protein